MDGLKDWRKFQAVEQHAIAANPKEPFVSCIVAYEATPTPKSVGRMFLTEGNAQNTRSTGEVRPIDARRVTIAAMQSNAKRDTFIKDNKDAHYTR